jgi:hypothetical protein
MADQDIKNRKPTLEELDLRKKNKKPKKIRSPYDKKLRTYIIKIIIEILFIVTFMGGVFLFIYLSEKSIISHEDRLKEINNKISRLEIDTRNIKGKVEEVRIYKKRWDKSSLDLMGLTAMKDSYLKDRINSLTSKYKIHNFSLTTQKSQKTDINSLNLKSLYLNATNGKMSFSAITDIEGINFIQDVISKLSGFFIISKIMIEKSQNKYNSKNILKIKIGDKEQFIIDFNIDFTWYAIKKR